ncbi:MAG: electron transport complex subunit RsxC [Clostridia bacterium]|nr:electron transport complex subunit RsxC [Clostridia bacterium]
MFALSSRIYTFNGGTRVEEYKNTRGCKIERIPAPERVEIPMAQHIGVQCRPVVSVGDHVYRGQLIGNAEGLTCLVHASISGTVSEIKIRHNAQAQPVETIVITGDGKMELDPSIRPHDKKLSDTTPDEIIEKVRLAGISGMGGAMFPTHAKIRSSIGKVERLIINCAECEPFITVNHRLMLERPEDIVNGTKILMRALGLSFAELCVEDNKVNAVNRLLSVIGNSDYIKVRVMKTKYPQGDERQLVFALTGREVPSGKLPADVGCVVFNAETCAVIYRAFAYGLPLIERCVTVDGDCVATPKNLLVPLGTSYRTMIDYCGGLIRIPFKIINGGPMMGAARWEMDTPVTKGTSAVLVLSEKFAKMRDNSACIRCGRCVKNCPMHLMPVYLAQYAMSKRYADAEKMGVMNCVECGTCSYNCPGNVEIVQYIRVAKGALRAAGNSKK